MLVPAPATRALTSGSGIRAASVGSVSMSSARRERDGPGISHALTSPPAAMVVVVVILLCVCKWGF